MCSFKQHLRQAEVAGKFVEFFGSGVSQLSVADRTTIANMCPEYGAILSFFPVDNVTLKHLRHTGKGEVLESHSLQKFQICGSAKLNVPTKPNQNNETVNQNTAYFSFFSL